MSGDPTKVTHTLAQIHEREKQLGGLEVESLCPTCAVHRRWYDGKWHCGVCKKAED